MAATAAPEPLPLLSGVEVEAAAEVEPPEIEWPEFGDEAEGSDAPDGDAPLVLAEDQPQADDAGTARGADDDDDDVVVVSAVCNCMEVNPGKPRGSQTRGSGN